MKRGNWLAHLGLAALVGAWLAMPVRAWGLHPDAPKGTRSNAAREVLAGWFGRYRVELRITPRNPGADQVTLLEIAVNPVAGAGAYAGPVILRVAPEGAASRAAELRGLPGAPGRFSVRHRFGAEGTYLIGVELDGAEAPLVGRAYIGYPTHPLAWLAELLLSAAFVLLGIGFAIRLGHFTLWPANSPIGPVRSRPGTG